MSLNPLQRLAQRLLQPSRKSRPEQQGGPAFAVGFLFFLLGCFGAFSGGLHAQATYPALRKQFFVGTQGDETPQRMIKAGNGELLLIGGSEDEHGCTDGWLARVDTNGNTEWTLRLGGKGCDMLYSGTFDKVGNIYVVGATGSKLAHREEASEHFKADYYIAKISPTGELQWSRTIGGSLPDRAYDGIVTNAQNFFVTGGAWSKNHHLAGVEKQMNNQWNIILNSTGQILREKVFGGDKNDWGRTICPSPDGGFLIGGVTTSPALDNADSRHNGDVWFAKLNFAGSLLWTQIIKAPYEDMVYRVAANPYGIYYAVGSRSTLDNGKQFWLAKLNDEGKVLMNKTFGGDGFEELRSLAIMEEGGLVVTGTSDYVKLKNQYLKGRRDFWVMKLDPQGELVWKQTYGGPQDESGVDVVAYNNGTIYALAQKENHFNPDKTSYGKDFWVVKIKDRPCETVDLDISTNITNYREKVGTPIKFINRTNIEAEWYWRFGDGTHSEKKSPTKRFQDPGVYNVQLTGYINESCKVSFFYPEPVIIEP
jgi:hypothetical protein